MIKNILVNLSLDRDRDVACDYASALAARFDAHLTGVAFNYEISIPGTMLGGATTARILEQHRRESEELVAAAGARLQKAASAAGIACEFHQINSTMAAAAGEFGIVARHYDLSVVGQPDPSKPTEDTFILEGALFESGRPVLVVPYVQDVSAFKLERVTIGWDGSRVAARAAADVLPLLDKNTRIELLIIDRPGHKADDLPGADMAQHLARHGLAVDIERITLSDIDVADAILSHVADRPADLLVMGGYGHSRLRESIFGGVTRTILESMTLPTLLSN